MPNHQNQLEAATVIDNFIPTYYFKEKCHDSINGIVMRCSKTTVMWIVIITI